MPKDRAERKAKKAKKKKFGKIWYPRKKRTASVARGEVGWLDVSGGRMDPKKEGEGPFAKKREPLEELMQEEKGRNRFLVGCTHGRCGGRKRGG